MEAEKVMRAEATHQRVGTQVEGEGVHSSHSHSQAEPIHLHQPLHSQQHLQQQQQQHPFDLKSPYQQTRRLLQPY